MMDLQTITMKNRIDPHKQLKIALETGILSEDEILEACESQHTGLENPGFCLVCGAYQDGCEPDAEFYECDDCGEKSVFGAEQLLFYLPSGFGVAGE